MAEFPDTPVFDLHEQESFQGNQCLRPYAAITKAQLLGLLTALGEYAVRDGMSPSVVGSDSDLAESHKALLRFYGFQVGSSARFPSTSTKRYAFSGTELPQVSSDDSQFVFGALERDHLSLNKYNTGFQDLTKRHLITFLEALGRYSLDATRMEQVHPILTGPVRRINAHNALINFREQPFTTDEFFTSVREALRKPGE